MSHIETTTRPWRRIIGAIATVPVLLAGLALGAGTANAADAGDGGLTDANLIASYDFEDANNKGKDDSGHGNDLTVEGGNVEYGVPGDHTAGGNAIQLRGVSGQYLKLPAGLLNGTDSFTVQFDSKSRMAANDNFFSFTIGSDNQKYFFSRLRPTSVYTAITKGSNGAEQGVTASQSANVWHTYRISVSPTFIATFIDGNLAGINKNVTTKLSDLGADLPVNFGKSTWGGDKYYNGGLDNIKIWKASYVADSMVWDGVTVPGSTEGDVTLPAKDALGNALAWTSSDTAVLGNDGKLVKSPAKDTEVTLTAKSTINGIEYSKDFTVVVVAAITTADAAAARLLVDYQLVAGAKLPAAVAGVDGATVAWKSSDTALVKDDGTVVGAEGDAEKTVDLTATVKLGDTTATKKFTAVRVMPKTAETIASYTRDGSVSGGNRVAKALHLALSRDGAKYEALNQNYGVAFAEAKIVTDETAKTQSTAIRDLTDPYLFRMADGTYAYVAIVTDRNGNRLDPGTILFSTSTDLVQWSSKPNDDVIDQQRKLTDDATPFDAGSLTAGYDASTGEYRVGWTVNGVSKYVTTKDFMTFSAVQPGPAFTRAQADLIGIANAVADSGNTIAVDAATAARVSEKLGRVSNTGVENPKDVTVEATTADQAKDAKAKLESQIKGGEKLDSGLLSKGATATATYSDGSTHDFRVNWNQADLDKIDLTKAGEYTVNGTIIQQNYSGSFPMMTSRADPNVAYWKGKYYFMGTSDTGGQQALFIRSSDTLEGLKDQKAMTNGYGGAYVEGQDHFLWGGADDTGHDGNGGAGSGGSLYHWAPELHAITDSNGVEHLYCFMAMYPTGRDGDPMTPGPNWNGPSAYVMELKSADADPLQPSSWTEHRVLGKDGGVLSPKGLSIDMTYFEVDGQSYIAWSQGSQTIKGEKAYMAIAKTTKDKPWQAVSDPVRIARPEYGWELDGVNEGPNVLVNDGKVYMVFSAQGVSPQYATGMLIADEGADLTKASSWTKSNYPWMHNGVYNRQYGLGHNAYFTDPYGDIYNVYHGMLDGKSPRSAAIVPIHFRADGSPILDMKVSEELDQSKKNVTLKVVVGEPASTDASLKSLTVAGVAVDLEKAASEAGASVEVADPSKVGEADVKAAPTDAAAKPVVVVKDSVVTVTVTAEDGTTKKVYKVALTKKAPETVPVDSVAVSVDKSELTVGETVQASATVAPEDATDKTVSWKSSDAKVATVDASGKVTAVAPGTVEITATAGGKSGKVSVTVKAKAEPKPTLKFTDVTAATPHAGDIQWLADQGISTGWPTGEGTAVFSPMGPVVRQDMAAFLYRLAGSPDYTPSDGDKARFTDVDESTPHYREVLWLASTGIAEGFRQADGSFQFGGNRAVVRQDMAAFLKRLADYQKADPSLGEGVAFTDVDGRTPHFEEIQWLSRTGVAGGYPDGTFGGMRDVVRQDMAAFLHRMDTNVLAK